MNDQNFVLYSQSKIRPIKKYKQSIISNKNKNKRNLLNYAKRAENRGDNRSAFQYYTRLLKIDSSDMKIIDGFIRTSIAIESIKLCENKLLVILDEYSNKNKDSLKYYIFLSELAYFYLSTGRDKISDQYLSQISASKKLEFNQKNLLISSIYEKSGKLEYATKILIDARNDIGTNKYSFSKQLYKLYFKNLEFKKASIELVNYLINNNLNKNKQDSSEMKFFEVETNFIKIFDSVEDERIKETIISSIISKRDDIKTIVKEVYSEIENDSLIIMSNKLGNEFNSLLFSLYFNNKEYSKAYEYLSTENDAENFNKIVAFSNQLFIEAEFELAYKYYKKILINDDFYSKNKRSKAVKQIFNNYIVILKKLKKSKEAISFLENLVLEKEKENLYALTINEIYLELAEIYQYELFDFSKAKNIYLSNFSLDKISKNKKRYNSNIFYLTASINYFELLLTNKNKLESDKVSEYIENNNYFYKSQSQRERYYYLFVVSSILVNNNYKLFFKRADSFIKKNLKSDYANDLLEIYFELKSIILFSTDGQIKKVSKKTNDLVLSYLQFKLNSNYSISEKILNTSTYNRLSEIIFIINLKYKYLRLTNQSDKLELFILNLLSDKSIGEVNTASKNKGYYFDEIFLDYVRISDKNKELKKEVLTYFLNNYTNSVLYDEARRLLRKM